MPCDTAVLYRPWEVLTDAPPSPRGRHRSVKSYRGRYYTLEATAGGLEPDAVRLLADAKAHGLEPDVVNVMAMDYGVAQTAAQMMADAKRDATGAEAMIRSLGL